MCVKKQADSANEVVGQRICKEVVPATRVLGKAPKIIGYCSEGMANHTNTQDSQNQTTQ